MNASIQTALRGLGKDGLEITHELEEQANLADLVNSIQLSFGPDKWASNLSTDG